MPKARVGVIALASQIPAIRRHQPGGADDLALAQGGDDQGGPPGHVQLQRDLALADQEELVGRRALAEQELARREAEIADAPDEHPADRRIDAGKERMTQQQAFKRFHGMSSPSGRPAAARRGSPRPLP